MCIIIYYRNKKNNILIKNRDTKHIPQIRIIHEIINNVEIIYIHDIITGWIEGLNDHGYAIINSSLNLKSGTKITDKNYQQKIKSQTKYLNAISTNSINKFQNLIINKSYYHDITLQGHTIFGSPYFCVHMESYTDKEPIINLLDISSVYTNNGIQLKNIEQSSWTISSILRKKIIEEELNMNKDNINSYSDLLNLLNINYDNLDTIYHPYRCNDTFTSSQLLMDLNNRVFIFNYDKNKCIYEGLVDRLPTGYKSKIKIKINKITKNIL
jgi:hypothetical protein